MSAPARTARLKRATNETEIDLEVDLDGGEISIDTGVDFFDHMLHALALHGGIGMKLRARGDGMDNHHLIEDVGIALGKAFYEALGEKRGIARFGSILLPLDDALIAASIDISGRSYLNFRVDFLRNDLGAMPTEMVGEFFRALADHARITVHLIAMHGHVSHHLCEATFKAFARAFAAAKKIDGDDVASTKGLLE